MKATSRRAARARHSASACRYTITHLSRRILRHTASAIALLATITISAYAQTEPQPPDDAFASGRWHAEFALQAALEAWNYNPSHEELYGLVQGVTYGLRNGLVLTLRQRLIYVSQRRNDSRVLGLTGGLRGRLYRRGRASVFLQFDFGISDAAIAVPPRGTRFNYLALGGGGFTWRINRRLDAITTLEVIHVSNAGIAGPDRNPDIEAIGPSVGLIIGF
jgi:hypothetical protein